jgi:hypothetical protein
LNRNFTRFTLNYSNIAYKAETFFSLSLSSSSLSCVHFCCVLLMNFHIFSRFSFYLTNRYKLSRMTSSKIYSMAEGCDFCDCHLKFIWAELMWWWTWTWELRRVERHFDGIWKSQLSGTAKVLMKNGRN